MQDNAFSIVTRKSKNKSTNSIRSVSSKTNHTVIKPKKCPNQQYDKQYYVKQDNLETVNDVNQILINVNLTENNILKQKKLVRLLIDYIQQKKNYLQFTCNFKIYTKNKR